MLGGEAPIAPSRFEIFDMKFYDVLWFCFCCCFLLFVILFLVCICWWVAIAFSIVCHVVRDNVLLFVVRSCLSVILLSNLPVPGGHCESGFPDYLPSRTKQHTSKVKPKCRRIKATH